MKILIRLGISLVIAIIVFILAVIWIDQYSPMARRGEWNIQRYKTVKKGMTSQQLVSILGKPFTIKGPQGKWQDDTVYYYHTHPFSSSSPIMVHIDSTKKVSWVVKYD